MLSPILSPSKSNLLLNSTAANLLSPESYDIMNDARRKILLLDNNGRASAEAQQQIEANNSNTGRY